MSYSAIAWAKENGTHFEWHCIANGYPETDRRCDYYSGEGWYYANEQTQGDTRVILNPSQEIKGGSDALFIIDDGRAVTPYYVAGWNPADGSDALYLHPFPTNYNADGTRRVSPRDGRPIDFGSWLLHPARAYHLKVRA
jgi:hypothetical protein